MGITMGMAISSTIMILMVETAMNRKKHDLLRMMWMMTLLKYFLVLKLLNMMVVKTTDASAMCDNTTTAMITNLVL